MQKLICSRCGQPMDVIENRTTSYFEWDDDIQGYFYNDPWGPSEFCCENCCCPINEDQKKSLMADVFAV